MARTARRQAQSLGPWGVIKSVLRQGDAEHCSKAPSTFPAEIGRHPKGRWLLLPGVAFLSIALSTLPGTDLPAVERGAAAVASPTPLPTVSPPPAPTPVATSMPGSTPSETTYAVQAGDNLSVIAHRFGTTVDAIVAANKLLYPSLIWSGQVLIIPAPPSVVSGLPGEITTAAPVAAPIASPIPLATAQKVEEGSATAIPTPGLVTGGEPLPNASTYGLPALRASEADSGGSSLAGASRRYGAFVAGGAGLMAASLASLWRVSYRRRKTVNGRITQLKAANRQWR